MFSLAILLTLIIGLSYVIKYQIEDNKICDEYILKLEEKHQIREDSLGNYYRKREAIQTEELNKTLRFIIESYKVRIDEQDKTNKSISVDINKNLK